MTTLSLVKRKVLKEIDLIPEDKMADLYSFIHYFRLGLEKSRTINTNPILAFAGSWQDMPDETFDEFTAEIEQRRHQAFSRRRKNEGSSD